MIRIFLRTCLVLAAIFGSTSAGFALPPCPGSPMLSLDKNGDKNWVRWNNCVGVVTYVDRDELKYKSKKIKIVSTYFGEFKDGSRHGEGIYKQTGSNQILEGVWVRHRFQYSKKTPYSIQPSYLQIAFSKLSKQNRMQLQKNLALLGFYNFEIDGLYGKGTAAAMAAYNQQNLNGADLTKTANVTVLLKEILNIKSEKKVEDTVLVPKKRKPNVATTEPEIDYIKEFQLSFYGSFIHSEKVPNALFFFEDIKKNDSFYFRKALRNHDVNLIVLSSQGGNVWEGLNIAGIINDKGLNTYIPRLSGNCASACSFMFFAGSDRRAGGKLGVHQFYSKSSAEKKAVGQTEKSAQFTVSEIIGFLNDFETPPWVFERMFQQSEMYYFKESELAKLETEVSEETKKLHLQAEKFISDLTIASKMDGD